MGVLTSVAKQRFFKLCDQIQTGTLSLRSPEGERMTFGEGQPMGELIIHDWNMLIAIAQRGDIGLGESYVDGLWDSPDVEALLRVLLANSSISKTASRGSWSQNFKYQLMDRLIRRNSKRGSRRNIQAHYDVGNSFYRLWLDESMTYSSAIYDGPDQPMVNAQTTKYARLNNLLPETAETVLEIGCGWGGFAEHAAQSGRTVTGLTISNEQKAYAEHRLGSSADIRLQDYRDVAGKFDAIVSIEMVEAVGEAYWPGYFRKIKNSLTSDGGAAIQAIIVEDEYFEDYRTQSDFIRQYTFPGGMLIPPSQIQACAQAAGLKVGELFRFGQDYARTLREWLNRLNQSERDIRALGYSEKFLRSWRYYLQFCAAGFADGKKINVAQFSLAHA